MVQMATPNTKKSLFASVCSELFEVNTDPKYGYFNDIIIFF